jgi:hypothetical protein
MAERTEPPYRGSLPLYRQRQRLTAVVTDARYALAAALDQQPHRRWRALLCGSCGKTADFELAP